MRVSDVLDSKGRDTGFEFIETSRTVPGVAPIICDSVGPIGVDTTFRGQLMFYKLEEYQRERLTGAERDKEI